MKLPAPSSKKLRKLLRGSGAYLARQGKTDHANFIRETPQRKFAAPVQMGKKNLAPAMSN